MTYKVIIPLLISICTLFSCKENKDLDLWNAGANKTAIIDFVNAVTDKKSKHYLAPSDRIAVFDMDGTILLEKPNYSLFDLATRQILEDVEQDSSLKTKQPYKAIYENDWSQFDTDWYSPTGLYSVLLYAAEGMTDEEYNKVVEAYFHNVKDRRYGVSYDKLVYAPVVQLIDYLKANQFDVYISSGSTVQYIRAISEKSAHIDVDNVIGTTILTEWQDDENGGRFVKQAEFVKPINDEAGKVVNIRNKIGKVPVFAFGNSHGDLHMLNYSKNAPHSIQMIVNHDDAEREYAYNTKYMSDLCDDHDWHEVSMKNDFKIIFDPSLVPKTINE